MAFYISAFVFLYFWLAVGTRRGKSSFLLLIIGAAPLITLAVMRGRVGTDTAAYAAMFEMLYSDPTSVSSVEPLFLLLSIWLISAFQNSTVVIAILAVLTTVILFTAMRRFGRNSFVLGWVFIPIFYQPMTMNGLRYGLAFAIIAFSVALLTEGRRTAFVIGALVAGLIHTSSLVLALLCYICLNRVRISYVVAGVFSSLALIAVDSMILLKLENYVGRESPSITSGLSTLLVSLILLGVIVTDKTLRVEMYRRVPLLLGAVFFYIFPREDYVCGSSFSIVVVVFDCRSYTF